MIKAIFLEATPWDPGGEAGILDFGTSGIFIYFLRNVFPPIFGGNDDSQFDDGLHIFF